MLAIKLLLLRIRNLLIRKRYGIFNYNPKITEVKPSKKPGKKLNRSFHISVPVR